MITISSVVDHKIRTTPFIAEGLFKNLINISELARVWHKEVEAKTKKEITIDALAMAIRRSINESSIQIEKQSTQHRIRPTHTTIRTNLIERTYTKSPTIMKSYKRLTDIVHTHADSFITMSMGIHEITLITDQSLEHIVDTAFKDEHKSTIIDNLSAIILKLPAAVIDTPGSYYSFLGKLAWAGINIEEVVSTAHELMIIVKEEVAHEAFKTLTTN